VSSCLMYGARGISRRVMNGKAKDIRQLWPTHDTGPDQTSRSRGKRGGGKRSNSREDSGRCLDSLPRFGNREVDHGTQGVLNAVALQKANAIEVDLSVGARALASDRKRTPHFILATECTSVGDYLLHEPVCKIVDILPSAPLRTKEGQHPVTLSKPAVLGNDLGWRLGG